MIPRATTFVFLGRTGSGKDTQADFLKKLPDFSDAIEISTGDFFREFATKSTLLGRKTKETLGVGGRQPDWFAFAVWLFGFGERVQSEEIILASGSPRSLREAGLIDEALKFVVRPKAIAIYIEVSREEAKKRLFLRARSDDSDKEINRRMEWFETDVMPAVEYYKNEGRLIEVNGEQSPAEVFKELEQKLEKYFIK